MVDTVQKEDSMFDRDMLNSTMLTTGAAFLAGAVYDLLQLPGVAPALIGGGVAVILKLFELWRKEKAASQASPELREVLGKLLETRVNELEEQHRQDGHRIRQLEEELAEFERHGVPRRSRTSGRLDYTE
jgi:uncharacterized MnhB-related membrane protein